MFDITIKYASSGRFFNHFSSILIMLVRKFSNDLRFIMIIIESFIAFKIMHNYLVKAEIFCDSFFFLHSLIKH